MDNVMTRELLGSDNLGCGSSNILVTSQLRRNSLNKITRLLFQSNLFIITVYNNID